MGQHEGETTIYGRKANHFENEKRRKVDLDKHWAYSIPEFRMSWIRKQMTMYWATDIEQPLQCMGEGFTIQRSKKTSRADRYWSYHTMQATHQQSESEAQIGIWNKVQRGATKFVGKGL